ncbi:MAG: sugar ABC transporter ATP-binding protein [Xanthobacteraceae bacterium]
MTVAIKDLWKAFGGAYALSGVDFEVDAGEVHALLGPNGAGKSTLIRCLSGAVAPDAGTIVIDGRSHAELTPKEAIDKGVAVIYQNLSLIPSLTVTENVFLGDELTRWGLVRRRAQRQRVANLLHAVLGATEIDPEATVGSLPLAARQLVEVAKALHRARVKLLILDEPTAALTETETQILFDRLRNLRSQGLHIIYITHRLGEVFEIADRVTVLRDGKVVLSGQSVASIEPEAIVTAIAGEPIKVPARDNFGAGAPILALEGLTGTRFGPIDLEVGPGQIVGLFGALGSGRTELLETIIGYRRATSGRVLVGGHVLNARKPAAALAAGIALVPADRLRQGLFGELDARDNVLLPSYARLATFGFRSRKFERRMFAETAQVMAFPPAFANRRGRQLSGGTQQKLVVGRWLRNPHAISVLLMDEPTQGVDVGARSEIYKIILASARRDGRSVLFASSDHEEVVALADRALVMKAGRVVASFERNSLSEDDLIHAAHLGKLEVQTRRIDPMLSEKPGA